MKGWRLTSTAGGDTSHNPPTHARSDCAKAFLCCRLASRLSPRDSRRRQPTVAAAAHARLAQSYAVCSPLMASRHAPTHSCDANMRLGPVTARRRRQAVTCRQTHPLKSRPHDMSACHEKRHRNRERERLRSVGRNNCWARFEGMGLSACNGLPPPPCRDGTQAHVRVARVGGGVPRWHQT